MTHLRRFLRKINIHYITYIYFLVSIFTGYWKYYIGVYTIVFIHELCHLLMAYSFHFKINKIELLPFGVYLSLDDFGYKPKLYEMCIVLSGPCIHFFIYLILKSLSSIGYFEYLLKMNSLIFMFNLLPIYPLDGFRLLLLLMQVKVDLQKSNYLAFKISIFFLCVFLIKNNHINNYVIFIYLLMQNIEYYRNIPNYLINYFIKIPYFYKNNKIKIHNDLKYIRDSKNYYSLDSKIYSEEMIKYQLLKSVKRIEK